jgi:hypothetical protein
MRDLLLHRLSPAQTEQLEDQILHDAALADQLEIEENDLIDDYTRGVLSGDDAGLVEKHLLASPGSPRRLAFSKALFQAVQPDLSIARKPAERDVPILRSSIFVGALAAGFLLMISSWLYIRFHQGPTDNSASQPAHSNASARGGPVTSEPSDPGESAAPFTIALVANNSRGGQVRTFAVPSGVALIRIQCEVSEESPFSESAMVVKDSNGHMVTTLEHLRVVEASGIYYVEGTISPDQLRTGRYSVSVHNNISARNSAITYNFFVRSAQK